MSSTFFNDNWTVGPKTSVFSQLGRSGGEVQTVRLPHDALIGAERSDQGPGSGKNGYFPSSAIFEYTKKFVAPEEWRGQDVRLEFQGVMRDAVVFVNDAFVGQRPYGYSIFEIQLDEHLRYGEENTIRVETRAHDDSRWYTGSGITRDVILHVTDVFRLQTHGLVAVATDVDDERAVIEVEIPVVNGDRRLRTARAAVEIRDAAEAAVAQAQVPLSVSANSAAVGRARLYVPAPKRWSVEEPYLYSLTVVLSEGEDVLDQDDAPLGIRTIRLDPQHGLRINDEIVKLRGACVHHDNGALGGVALAAAEERRIRLLKDAGFNAIRSAHNPLSVPMLEACDRLGMIVMDETFDVWHESKSAFDYSLSFDQWWERDVDSMVLKDRSHPSVIFYSIGNEIIEIGNPRGVETGRMIAERIRRLDPTRLITNGVNGFVASIKEVMSMMHQATQSQEASGGVNDVMGNAGDMMNRISASDLVTAKTEEAFAQLDVAGINYGDARYALDAQERPNRISVGTETFPSQIDSLWELVETYPQVLGDFTWAGWDYLGEVGLGRPRYSDQQDKQFEAPYPWLTAWAGDLDITGARRPISYYREIVFGLRDAPYIAVHRPENYGRVASLSGWSWADAVSSWSWDVAEGTPIAIDVYSNADTVELVCNGDSLGTAVVGEQKKFIASFNAEYRAGEIEAIAYRDGAEISRTSLRSAVGPAELVLTADNLALVNTSGDASYLSIELRDAEGTLQTQRDVTVTVEVTGSGFLAGLMSGRPNPDLSLTGPTVTTYGGRAVAVVRPSAAGDIVVTVSAEDLNASLALTVKGSE